MVGGGRARLTLVSCLIRILTVREGTAPHAWTTARMVGCDHWPSRLAAEIGRGDATAARSWRRYGCSRGEDVQVLFLCVAETSQIQSLDRTAPILPIQAALPQEATHGDDRHGVHHPFRRV